MLLRGTVLLIAFAGCGGGECDYDKRSSCETGSICARTDQQRNECVAFDSLDAPLRAPFVDGHAFSCAQGPHSEAGSTHAYRNDVFAIDLPSRTPEPGVVVAPMDGEAFVFDGCQTDGERDDRPEAKNDSTCGLGYGNHVKIWDGQTMVLVAHLSKVTIKGGIVRAGQQIGVEGVSGAAGTRHVHMSVSRPAKGDDVRKILSTPGWTGKIPVRFRLTVREAVGSSVKVQGVDELRCRVLDKARATYYP